MRVAIDARLLEVRSGGSSTCLRSLLRALARREDRNEYLLLGTSEAAGQLHLDHRFSWVPSPGISLLDERWEQLALPGLLCELAPDLFFGAASILPAVKTCSQVCIIHDVGFEEEPGFYATPLRNYLTTWVRAAARQSDLVLTVSEHSRLSICRNYSLSRERVRVIYPAPEEHFAPVPAEVRASTLAQYGLADGYLLSVAGLEPNKNLGPAIIAYQRAGGLRELGHRLVLVGEGSAQRQLEALISRLYLKGEVHLMGHVPCAHLASFYTGAACFLWPSLYEGFGLPPLEAMACGTPVISSNRAAMPEVLGQAAVFVDPTEPSAIADALRRLLADPASRQELRRQGLMRAASSSWEETARATLDAFASVLEGRP